VSRKLPSFRCRCGGELEYVDASHREGSIEFVYGYFECEKCGLRVEVRWV